MLEKLIQEIGIKELEILIKSFNEEYINNLNDKQIIYFNSDIFDIIKIDDVDFYINLDDTKLSIKRN